MLVRGESLGATMSQYLIDDIAQTPNIRVEYGMEVVAVHGEEKLEALSISCGRSGTVDTVPATCLFVFIGAEPRTEWLDGFVERDDRGFILTGPELMREGKRPPGWTAGPRPVPAGNQRARRFCGGRRSSWLREASRFRRRRGLDRHSVRS